MANFKKNNWSLTIVGTYNEYRHRLRLFQRFILKTRLLDMMKMVLFFSESRKKRKTHMVSVVKFAYTSKEGLV